MKKQNNKYINIESYNTINNYSSEKRVITVNRLNNNEHNKTIINQRRKRILFEKYDTKPFIYRKKSNLERANSFCIKNMKNINLKNNNTFLKEAKPLLLIPSYKFVNLKKNYSNYENKNKKKIKSKKKLETKYKIYFSRNNKYEPERFSHNNYNNKYFNLCERYNSKNKNKSQSKTKGNSSNSTGISYGETNKTIKKYNCYSFDDDIILKGDQNTNNYDNDELNDDKSIITLWNISNNENDNNNSKYIKTLEKQNELLKQELIKTNNKLNILQIKIDNLIEGKLLKGIPEIKIKAITRQKTPTYKKSNIIKKCPIPTPYVQKFSKNDFFSSKKKDIKVTLKVKKKYK